MSKLAMPIVHRALKVSVKAHRKDERDGEHPMPYSTHPIEVASMLRYVARVTDEEVLAAALLHDALEETKLKEDELLKEFGRRVTRIVKELTRREGDYAGMPPEQIHEIRTQKMLEEIDRMSDEAKLIKLADRCSNLRLALATRAGQDLERYVWQTHLILDRIDRNVCAVIWDEIRALCESAATNVNGQKKTKAPA
jgi:guanosine-3',5'-bis(diphosphate) 3'-pyrophosphohydrolase